MDRVAHYGKAVARRGQGAQLAELLLAAAEELVDDPGSELYLINRQVGGSGAAAAGWADVNGGG